MLRQGPEFETERRVAAERTLDLVRECLVSSHIRKKMGKIASEIEEVSYLARVPDIVDGFVMDLEGYDDQDIFPFVAARVNEKLISTMIGASSPMQSAKIEIIAAQLGLSSDSKDFTEERSVREAREYCLEPNEKGVNWGAHSDLSSDEWGSLYCAERPFVLVNKRRSIKEMAVYAVHELTHAYDALTDPIFHGRSGREIALETELRAYTLDDAINSLLFGEDSQRDVQSVPRFVAKLRRRINGSVHSDTAFRPDERISKAIERAGVARHFDYL